MPSSSNDSSSTAVRVAVRVRPMLALEHGNQECLNVNTSSNQINIGKTKKIQSKKNLIDINFVVKYLLNIFLNFPILPHK